MTTPRIDSALVAEYRAADKEWRRLESLKDRYKLKTTADWHCYSNAFNRRAMAIAALGFIPDPQPELDGIALAQARNLRELLTRMIDGQPVDVESIAPAAIALSRTLGCAELERTVAGDLAQVA